MKKKILSLALAWALCLGLTVSAFAAELKIDVVPVPTVEEYEGADYTVSDFHEGFARVWLRDGRGTAVIDETYKVVIPPEYDNVGEFSEGLAVVNKNGKCGFIDKTGKLVVPLQYSIGGDFCEGLAVVQKDGKYGFIDKTGKEVVPFIYDGTTAGFSQGLAAMMKEYSWGFIDAAGKEVIPFQYDDAYGFSEGFARVCMYEKGWGCVDLAGNVVIDFQYDEMGACSEGLIPVRKVDKWGYTDKSGELVIPFEYENAGRFSEGLAAVMQDGKWGFIDRTGKLVVPCKYMDADAFSEGFAAVQAYDEEHVMWGFIDKTGKEVVPPTTYTENGVEYGYFCRGSVFHDGAARVGRISINGGKNPPVVYLVLTVDAKVSGWAREQVDSAAVKGLMPDSWGDDFTVNITRAEFAALAVKLYEAMSGESAPAPGASPFSDSSDAAVIQAEALGIVGGVGGDRFAPDDLVTREEAATMLSRVYTKLGGVIPEVGATTFADNDSVSTWAKDAVAFMSDKEIVNGVEDNKFDPTGNASIEQAMVIAMRMFQNLK
ncbi:MAG: hypothetical protein HDT15_07865 [Oscillibacter sp.]|nr:hypothetical protein [Oscillibacter sp.]MBD5169659.1 hypothetical protein [Oscillibacter sp.]